MIEYVVMHKVDCKSVRAGCLEGFDAHTIKGYVLHEAKTQSQVHVPYPTDENGSTWGKAFHHGKFVMALRRAAIAEEK